jgi:hypothetical protein
MSEPWRGAMFVSGRLLHYPFAVRYGVAIVAAAVGLFVRMALDPFWGDALRFPTFYAVVMVSAWIGGFGPGLVTTLLGISRMTSSVQAAVLASDQRIHRRRRVVVFASKASSSASSAGLAAGRARSRAV